MIKFSHARHVLLLAVALLAGNSQGEVSSNAMTQIDRSLSPDHSLGLFIIEGRDTTGEKAQKLALMSIATKTTLATFSLSKKVAALTQLSHITNILWKHDNTCVAISLSDQTTSCVLVCLNTSYGRFKWVNLGATDNLNQGIQGKPQSDFVRVEYTPIRWADATEGSPRMLWIRRRLWDKSGQLQILEQSFAITPGGEIMRR
ncbi:MAG TPA: hypothetical protein VHG71_10700 [Verrucomicrobiae bacterium]|nr:hypothetical protein [Verrucomicrobiae bacterium]